MPAVVGDGRAMIAAMEPVLCDRTWVFAQMPQGDCAGLAGEALAIFHEDEGTTLVVPRDVAERAGFDVGLPMRRIVLTVHSALDGVGLTAAVSSALAACGIACNVIAAFSHDHLFVPADRAGEALGALIELQRLGAGT